MTDPIITTLASNLSVWLEDGLAEEVDRDALPECGQSVTAIIRDRPEEVKELAHTKLHTWPFKDVPLCWRRAYEEASLQEARKYAAQYLENLLPHKQSHKRDCDGEIKEETPVAHDVVDKFVPKIANILDMAIVLTGAPGRRELIDWVFERLQQHLEATSPDPTDETKLPASFPVPKSTTIPLLTYKIPSEPSLSLSKFQKHLSADRGPLVIGNIVNHWPAYTLWHSPDYLHRHTLHGLRLVPIELGRSYTDSAWSQRIMSFSAYLRTHLLSPSPERTGYLAQHDLLDQVPALANDTLTPDLCHADPPDDGKGQEKLDAPVRNAWFGPGGTISPLHTDPYHNILCQVVGRKYIRLYAPGETEKLYPRGVDEAGVSMENTSRVDVHRARELYNGSKADDDDAERKTFEEEYPHFREAEYQECVLEAGQCLYIPVGWWHYVESLETSFNVSYWFN
ncbi:Clavaminate synthase-like protein [Myriangium duriaei CBS 260.36]|uniref:Clavaminate synthase-like protein n=1 Tax=Myriangium duriaei CBS 260.36 TaxID=1168546 RepID=A0A9P4J674_9PEZI|nr:Clavaminate synthase-like protein [Myriangium duriaei CBS 260.36]